MQLSLKDLIEWSCESDRQAVLREPRVTTLLVFSVDIDGIASEKPLRRSVIADIYSLSWPQKVVQVVPLNSRNTDGAVCVK